MFIAAIFSSPDLISVEGWNKDGGPNLWVLQTQPASVRYILTSSAFCLEEETLDNRNSVFLINPDNRQHW